SNLVTMFPQMQHIMTVEPPSAMTRGDTMPASTEPSYTDLVYEVLRSADRPLTVPEIVDAVSLRRPITTKNPKSTVRSALSSGAPTTSRRQLGRRGRFPAHPSDQCRRSAGRDLVRASTQTECRGGHAAKRGADRRGRSHATVGLRGPACRLGLRYRTLQERILSERRATRLL